MNEEDEILLVNEFYLNIESINNIIPNNWFWNFQLDHSINY
jgi:hypothetical protein